MSKDKDTLGMRMKGYEEHYKLMLPGHGYYILRVDGRAFHTFTNYFDKPWDQGIRNAMDAAAIGLCGDVSGSVFAYTQSDEISLLFVAGHQEKSEPHFGGVVQKIVSTAAATASVVFNRRLQAIHDKEFNEATFDARVFHLPDENEVANYFIWRQKDAIRNSIQVAARSVASHKECLNKKSEELKQLYLDKTGQYWEDIDMGHRQGYVAIRVEHPFEGYLRHTWEMDPAIEFRPYWQEGFFLHRQIPRLMINA